MASAQKILGKLSLECGSVADKILQSNAPPSEQAGPCLRLLQYMSYNFGVESHTIVISDKNNINR